MALNKAAFTQRKALTVEEMLLLKGDLAKRKLSQKRLELEHRARVLSAREVSGYNTMRSPRTKSSGTLSARPCDGAKGNVKS